MTTAQQVLPPPYPLAWPPGRARTPSHERLPGRYNAATFAQALGTIEIEVARWQKIGRQTRLVDWQLTTDHVGRARDAADVGASLWFVLAGKEVIGDSAVMVLACDRFEQLPQNVRAISLTMERLRLVDEIGAYSLVSAVEGARMLPPPAMERPWRDVLGLGNTAPLAVAEASYRALARDAGEGSGGRLVELNLAIEAARRELGR